MWHGTLTKYSSAKIKIDGFYIFKRWPKLMSTVTQGVSNWKQLQTMTLHKNISASMWHGKSVVHTIILHLWIGMKLRTKYLQNNTSKRLIVECKWKFILVISPRTLKLFKSLDATRRSTQESSTKRTWGLAIIFFAFRSTLLPLV